MSAEATTYTRLEQSRSRSPEAKRIRRSPSLAGQWWAPAALVHVAGDEAKGRVWLTSGCQCSPCHVAREVLAGRWEPK